MYVQMWYQNVQERNFRRKALISLSNMEYTDICLLKATTFFFLQKCSPELLSSVGENEGVLHGLKMVKLVDVDRFAEH